MGTNRGKQKVSLDDESDVFPLITKREREREGADPVRVFRSMLAEKDLLTESLDNYRTMLRFLEDTRSRNVVEYDYDRAIHKWEEMIKWRRSNGVDTIIQDFVYKEQEDVRLCYPQGFHGVDKAGRPIYIKYCDKIDCAKLLEVTTVERLMKSYIQECEKMVVEKFPACSEIANKPIDSVIYIIVLSPSSKNLNKEFEAYMELVKLTFRLGHLHNAYYPQTVHQMFFINAGIGRKLLIGLNNLLRDRRKRPIDYYALGKHFRTKLLEFIDEDQLPTLLGGSCSCPEKEGGCLRFEKGPWEVKQTKDKNAEMVIKKRKEIVETMKNIPSSPPETIQRRNGSALSLETDCHKCTELENKVNFLSRKLDNLQTTLNLLLPAQERANCCGASRKLKKL